MKLRRAHKVPGIFLRIAIAAGYLWASADRLGMIGAHGQPHVGWGDWSHFMAYCHQIIGFLPEMLIPPLAIFATTCEIILGLLLLFGLFTRWAAICSGLLSLCFAISMVITFGIESPLNYSVFTLSAASFLLSTAPTYTFSLDTRLRTLPYRSLQVYGREHLIYTR